MFSKIHETYRIYWNHHQKHACEIWGSSEKLQFLMEKCLQRRTLKTVWNLDIFSMFSKIHETYRIYWNHHQKHACEIWGSLEKLQFLTEKCLQRRTFRTGWNFDFFSMFSKIHETYRIYWNHHQKHACEIWGISEKLQFLTENAYSAEPSEQDEILTFSQCSPKFMKLTEFIEITTRNMHVKFEAFRRSYNFWQKNAYSAGPSKQDEILRFSQCSPKFMKLTEVIGITTRNMHVKFEAVWRSYNFWWKMPTAPNLQNRMKFWLFLNVLQNSWNLQNLLKSPPETWMWNLRHFGEVTIFDRKMPTAPDLQNRMKFWGFLNVLQNSWNLQKLLESPLETCMWNLRQFGEVPIFDGKCLQRRTLKTGWNLDIFSMFSKIHETYRSYWNHHQKHACEIWGSLEKLQFLTEKCLQRRTFRTGWNFDFFSMFSKIHETYRIYWNHHQKHACEIWGISEKLQFLTENAYSAEPSEQDEILTFSQCSPKFMKLTEFIEITTRNMHVKFEAFRRSYNFWQKNAYSAGPSKQDEILRFSQCSPKFMKLTEVIGITTRNMHVKFEAVRRSSNFWWKMPTAPDLQNRMKFWHFLNVLQNSWHLQNLLESPPEACMWKLRQFGEVTIFDRKMPTAPDLKNRMKFWHFLNVLQNSWNLQNLLESPPETCMWNLRQFGEVPIFDGKMPTAPDLQNWMKFWLCANVLQNSWNLQKLLESPPETCMWNLRQFGEVTIFDGKMPTAPDLKNWMKFRHFLNVLQNSWNLQKLLESPPETCMWNLRQFGEVTIFDGKMPTAPDLQNRMKFWDFLNVLQNSWNLQNFFEITTRNMHVKFEAVWRSSNFWWKNAYSAGPSKQDEILTFSQCSPKFMKLTEIIGITTRNIHVKFEAVRRSYNFWWKMPTAPDLQNRMKFWHFLNVLQNSWNLQNLLESPPETCMWNLRQFGEVTIFDGKMPTAPDL